MTNRAVFGGGCFWCTEAVFQLIKGVDQVTSGYSGGSLDNPSYQDLHDKETGHAEVIEVEFDPEVTSYEQLLQIFYYVHDPTTPNQQGNDIGAQYRSIILYIDDEQKQIAEQITREFAPTLWDKPAVTEIKPLEKFWPAEDYHQNYFASHPEQAYCQLIINPKLAKFKEKFQSLLKN